MADAERPAAVVVVSVVMVVAVVVTAAGSDGKAERLGVGVR
jgi:hypothetical protein